MRLSFLGAGRLSAAASLIVAFGGCTASSSSPSLAYDAGRTCVSLPGFDCTNAVNAALLPILVADGVTPTLADDRTLCRRLAVDLTGVTPSWDEYTAHCAGKSPAEMVDYFQGRPEYVRIRQRYWADAFRFDNQNTWYAYIADLDALVGRLYQGELTYPEFAITAVTHPAFIAEYSGENVVAYAYLDFLGRDALPQERQDMLSLYRMWRLRGAYDPALTRFKYNACKVDADCDKNRSCVEGTCVATNNYTELYIDPSRCHGPVGTFLCTSALHDATASLDGDTPITLAQLTPAQWEVVRTPGRVLVAQAGFWETAVDDVLTTYTGWWKSGFQLPGYEVPEVRDALTAYFKSKNGDVRALEREVLTSALYTMSAAEADGHGGPYWHRGPIKQMPAEVWLDSVGKIAGVSLGACDPRFPFQSARWLPPSMAIPKGDLPELDYVQAARVAGGCPDQIAQLRVTDVGVLYAMEQRTVLSAVCSSPKATRFLPPPGATPTDLVRALFHEALTQEPADLGDIASTLPAADEATARALCQGLLRTAPFLFP